MSKQKRVALITGSSTGIGRAESDAPPAEADPPPGESDTPPAQPGTPPTQEAVRL